MGLKVISLGTAGGRIVVLNQIRASGGFILEMDNQLLHIDPGPGALVKAKEYGINLRRLTGIFSSHAHPDHYTDLEVIIEAMTLGAKQKKGVLVANEHVIKGGNEYRQVVSPYHLKKLERYEILKPKEQTKIGNIEIVATPTKHDEEKAIGFIFKGSQVIGYTSDTEYFESLASNFKGCDYLILNVLRPKYKPWHGHMTTDEACELINKVKPKLAIIQHFGMLMLRANPAMEAKFIEQKTGVKTLAAKDGMKLELGTKEKEGLEKWIR